jgi:hypothetical protein
MNCAQPLSLCEKIDALREAIFSRMIGTGDVTVVSMGAGQSRIQTEYAHVSVAELQKALKSLLMSPSAQCCPCYQDACAEAGIPLNRYAASTVFGRCENPRGCC